MEKEQEVCDGNHNFDNYIYRFVHCSLCIEEKPESVSPREYAHNEVGILKNGDIQVWCIRHEKNVVIFDMEKNELIFDPDIISKTDGYDINYCDCGCEEE